jgi:hypothetical protein
MLQARPGRAGQRRQRGGGPGRPFRGAGFGPPASGARLGGDAAAGAARPASCLGSERHEVLKSVHYPDGRFLSGNF